MRHRRNIGKIFGQTPAGKVSVFGVLEVCVFPHLDWIRRDAWVSVRI